MSKKARRGKVIKTQMLAKPGPNATPASAAVENDTVVPASLRQADPAIESVDGEWREPSPEQTVQAEPSVPPASDLDSRFFDDTLGSEGEPDALARRRAIFAAAAHRRAHLARYVKGAVAFSAALCVVALAKTAFVRGEREADGSRSSEPVAASLRIEPPSGAVALAAAPAGEVPPPPRAAEPVRAPSDVPAPPPEPVAASVAPNAAPPPAGPAIASAAAEAPEMSSDPAVRAKEARAARERARNALERGQLKASVDAGERSVSIDPTDGDAWLLLGAAYQQAGNAASASRCFKACLDQGKRGARSECAQMLRMR